MHEMPSPPGPPGGQFEGAVAQEVRAFIVDNFLFGRGDRQVSDDQSFLDQGIIDSTGVLELVTFLESRYRIQVKDEDLLPTNLDSVRNVTAYVTRKLAERRDPLAGGSVSGAERSSVSG